MINRQKAILHIDLVIPYKISLNSLLDLASMWECDLISISTSRPTQLIAMPVDNFEKIWGYQPQIGEHTVPEGTEFFIEFVAISEIKK